MWGDHEPLWGEGEYFQLNIIYFPQTNDLIPWFHGCGVSLKATDTLRCKLGCRKWGTKPKSFNFICITYKLAIPGTMEEFSSTQILPFTSPRHLLQHAKMLMGLILCDCCESNHSCSAFLTSGDVMSRNQHVTVFISILLLLYCFYPLFGDFP